MIIYHTFPPCPVIHPKRHRELLEETLIQGIAKHTVYRVSSDGNVEAHTEKQEYQTVHMGSPSPGATKGSPVLQPQTTRSPAVTSAIPNFPKTCDSLWK